MTEPPKLTAIDRARRLHRIAELRDSGPGGKKLAWAKVAEAVGLSQSHTKALYHEFQVSQAASGADVVSKLGEFSLQYETLLQAAWQQYEDTEPGSSQRNQALGRVLQILEAQISFLQRSGRLPQSLAWPQIQMLMQEMLQGVGAVLAKYDVPEDAMQELLQLAEDKLGPSRTIAVQAA